MTIVTPADITLYRQPIRISCSGVPMHQSPATVPLPPCIICSRTSHYAPGTLGWITTGEPETGWAEKLFLICWACDGDSDTASRKKSPPCSKTALPSPPSNDPLSLRCATARDGAISRAFRGTIN